MQKQLNVIYYNMYILQTSTYTFILYNALIFSQFLNDNFDYDEVTALEQLAAYGLKGFMFDLAKVILIIQSIIVRGYVKVVLSLISRLG